MSRWTSFELGLIWEIEAMLGGPDQVRRRPHDVERLRSHLLAARSTATRGLIVALERGSTNGFMNGSANRNGNAKRPRSSDIVWPQIPADRLRPILTRRYNGTEVAIEDLARRSGVPVRIVKGVLRGQLASVDFRDADALLAAAGETTAWHDELEDLYALEEAA